MHSRRVRRWVTRTVLAAVLGVAAVGLHQAGLGRIVGNVLQGIDVTWGVASRNTGDAP
jgi:hypothetical protein